MRTRDSSQVPSTTEAASTFSLARFLEDVRTLVPEHGRARYERLPDGRTTIVFRELEAGGGDLCVAGPRTRAHFKDARGVTRAVILQLKPGWSVPLLGIPAHLATDRVVPLDDIWGRAGTDLLLELTETRDVTEVVERITSAIARRLPRHVEPASARLARRAAGLLEGGEVRVDAVAERLGISSRHLRRAFVASVGVGPKDYARAVRLRRAIRLADARASAEWGRLATEAGYYDQAHLIAEFRELVGMTPGAFQKRSAAPAG